MRDFILGLKLAICYIKYGSYLAVREKLMSDKCISIKNVEKLNRINKKIKKLELIIKELESLG